MALYLRPRFTYILYIRRRVCYLGTPTHSCWANLWAKFFQRQSFRRRDFQLTWPRPENFPRWTFRYPSRFWALVSLRSKENIIQIYIKILAPELMRLQCTTSLFSTVLLNCPGRKTCKQVDVENDYWRVCRSEITFPSRKKKKERKKTRNCGRITRRFADA